MRRRLAVAAIVLGVVGAGYCFLGMIMNATFTENGTGVVIFLGLFIVGVLVAITGVLVLRRDSRRNGSSSAA